MKKTAFLLLVLTAAAAYSQEVIVDKDAAGIIDRAITLPAGDFTFERLADRARVFLNRYGHDHALLCLTMGLSEHDVARSLFHRVTRTHNEEAVLRDLQSPGGFPRSPIARLLARRSGALLSYRGQDGELKELLLAGGRDPTIIKIETTTCKLLHFNFTVPEHTGLPQRQRNALCSLTLFFRSQPTVSALNAAVLARMFTAETGLSQIACSLRPDTWFLGVADYPDVYRFERDITLPTILEVRLRPTVTCSVNQGKLTCTGMNFQP